jgi:hypothetical protein
MSKIPSFDEFRMVSEVEPPEAGEGVRGRGLRLDRYSKQDNLGYV